MFESGMHPALKREHIALAGLLAALIPLYFLLPWFGKGMYASPDETSNAAVVRQLAWYGRLSIDEPLATDFPWLHSRSTVSHDATVVPVGFTGWPWVLSVFSFVLGQGSVPFLATMLLWSSAIPLFFLLRRFGTRSAWFGTLVAMTFPAMIVFGNRALFPQAAVVGFAVWSIFALTRLRSEHPPWVFCLVGVLLALTVASRPTELPWLLPWFAWSAWSVRPDRKRFAWACAGALFPLIILAFFAQASYGAFWKSGYLAHDNPTLTIGTSQSVIGASVDGTRSLLFPFGFHPRDVLWNVRSFLFGLLFPWTMILVGSIMVVGRDAWKGRREDAKRLLACYAVPLLSLWTVCVLIGYYGHGLYTDHVQIGAVTIANSFVRYLLPIGPIIGFAFAFFMSRLDRKRFGTTIGILLALGLVLFGSYTALARDDEGMFTTSRELVRYRDIRDRASGYFGPSDVILSERSDKIFSSQLRAVSPLPSIGEVRRLAKTHPELKIGLFARPLSQEQTDEWRIVGFEPVELFVSGREKLYLLQVAHK